MAYKKNYEKKQNFQTTQNTDYFKFVFNKQFQKYYIEDKG